MALQIALIGDKSPEVRAHAAIPIALELAGKETGITLTPIWCPTEALHQDSHSQLAGANGIWCVPGSPYKSVDGALGAIRFARESNIPFLGTCGGFQHALIEFARNVLKISDADHCEINPDAKNPLIRKLSCSLVGERGTISFAAGSKIAEAYGQLTAEENYHCRFGFNSDYRARFDGSELRFSGVDNEGEVRSLELLSHPFFIGTLFQPELSALENRVHPLIVAYSKAVAAKFPKEGLRTAVNL